jgi:hypothetical protein
MNPISYLSYSLWTQLVEFMNLGHLGHLGNLGTYLYQLWLSQWMFNNPAMIAMMIPSYPRHLWVPHATELHQNVFEGMVLAAEQTYMG